MANEQTSRDSEPTVSANGVAHADVRRTAALLQRNGTLAKAMQHMQFPGRNADPSNTGEKEMDGTKKLTAQDAKRAMMSATAHTPYSVKGHAARMQWVGVTFLRALGIEVEGNIDEVTVDGSEPIGTVTTVHGPDGMEVLEPKIELSSAFQNMLDELPPGVIVNLFAAPVASDEFISVQEAWEAAGGNPGIKATKQELLEALKAMDEAVDESDEIQDVLKVLPRDNDGTEQDQFEAWATAEKYDMSQHPLHWLFLNPETYAARKGWRAALQYVSAAFEDALKGHDVSPAARNVLTGKLDLPLVAPSPPVQKNIAHWPYCTECKQPFDFDEDGPFAYCSCGCTEWGYPRPYEWVNKPGALLQPDRICTFASDLSVFASQGYPRTAQRIRDELERLRLLAARATKG